MNPIVINTALLVRNKILEMSKRHRPDMSGYCGMASYLLHWKLASLGICSTPITGKYDNITHCWIIVDNQILDITATQFGPTEEVSVTSILNPRYVADIKSYWPQEELELYLPLYLKWFDS